MTLEWDLTQVGLMVSKGQLIHPVRVRDRMSADVESEVVAPTSEGVTHFEVPWRR